jgi:hypothetical protein
MNAVYRQAGQVRKLGGACVGCMQGGVYVGSTQTGWKTSF